MLSAVTPRQLSHETSIGLRSFDFDFERTLREYTTVKKAPRLACVLFARSVLDFAGGLTCVLSASWKFALIENVFPRELGASVVKYSYI